MATFKKVIKGLVYTGIVVAALFIGMFAGSNYSKLEDTRTTKIEECVYSEVFDGYWMTEVTRNGFGVVTREYTYFVSN